MKKQIWALVSLFAVTLILLAACVSSDSVQQQANSAAQLLRLDYVSSIDNSNRQYFVYLPVGYQQNSDKKWPVMLFLHGNGERGNGLDELDTP
ncbi:hypothetical protein ORJ04_15940 [Rheinheimera baltica]|uniref:Esterase n=1 Tax=Rheinheimera baltica TaxID=67576 RepID=A0ABT9I262_9GAMM|nr:hypothetical protein [Rheinheimera baltica]MDP5137447.1 hypothetical protein [Rheinheimera baltica]